MGEFMNTFMRFFTEAILPLMMMMLFMRMMIAMIAGMSRAFSGGPGFFP